MKWAYLVEDLTVPQQNDRQTLAQQLDKLGEDGWEVVAVSATGPSPSGALQYRTILKRARPEDGFGAVGIPVEDEGYEDRSAGLFVPEGPEPPRAIR